MLKAFVETHNIEKSLEQFIAYFDLETLSNEALQVAW